MPTLPSHQHREVAEGFGLDAARYDRARPDYPAGLIRRIVADLPAGPPAAVGKGGGGGPAAHHDAGGGTADSAAEGSGGGGGGSPGCGDAGGVAGSPGRRDAGGGHAGSGRRRPVVLDVGCGTGIAARQFREAGCSVLGVDVDARMAAVARGRGFAVEVGRFEEWDPAGRTFDAVVAGQTWHWVDPVAGAAKAATVLRPGGRLALFWNVFQAPPALAEALGAVYRRVLPGLPAANLSDALAAYGSMVVSATDGMAQAGGFGPAEEWRFEWDRTYGRDEWLDQIPTHGGVNRLPPATLQDLLAGVGAAIDAAGGNVPVHYTTVAVTAVRED